MKGKKAAFLFLAFLLPILVFLFLKMFGKNEFAVKPLYQDIKPELVEGCTFQPVLPYTIPDSVTAALKLGSDSLVVIWFGHLSHEAEKQFRRVSQAYTKDPVMQTQFIEGKSHWSRCIFFLKQPYDVILADHKGLIRGQYVSSDREEMDRLMIEVDIILKKY